MRLLILAFMLFGYLSNYAQNNQARIQTIETEINKAVEKGDYELAASLKKEKEILIDIDKAIASGDYEKAAELKKELSTLPSAKRTQINALQKQIDAAVASGDYEKAAQLKNEMEAIKNGSAPQTAQTNSSQKKAALKPEFLNQVYLWDKQNNSLRSLEKKEGEIKTSTVAAPFYASSTSYYQITGANSGVEINGTEGFVVEVPQGIDPSEQLKLIRFDNDKNNISRVMPYYQASGYAYGGSSGKVDKNNQPVSFRRIEGNVFEIIPNALPNGEYGFMYINKFYCFRKGPIGSFSSTLENISTRKANEEDPILQHGFFFDGLIQGAFATMIGLDNSGFYNTYSNTAGGIGLGFRLGNKWYFSNLNVYRPGIAVTWFKFNALIGIDEYAELYPLIGMNLVNVGFANAFSFNGKIGLEANVNFGLNIAYDPYWDDAAFGYCVNPTVKFRYKKFAVGLDISYNYGSSLTADYFLSTTYVGLTIGVKS